MTRLGRDLEQFQDPFGLLRRMVTLGGATARWLLVQRLGSVLAVPVDVLLGQVEKRRKLEVARSDLPLILIVGPPRSGTTLLYQLLAHCLDVSYFDNLDALFPRAPLTCRRLFGRPGQAAYNFRSYYGNTAGWYAPNDAFHVWNRWLGDHRYHARLSLTEAETNNMQRFFAGWLAKTGKPLLNKNNRNSDCVPLLADTLDNTVFVEVSRQPEYIVQSLLLARVAIQGRVEHGWGLDSEQVEIGAGQEQVIDVVCDQVIRIQRKLEHAAALVGDRRYLRVRYEDLCSDPGSMVKSVATFVPQVGLRSGIDLAAIGPFSAQNESRLPQTEIQYIRKRLAALT